MNKFVKGVKNLALASSFVAVSACNPEKKKSNVGSKNSSKEDKVADNLNGGSADLSGKLNDLNNCLGDLKQAVVDYVGLEIENKGVFGKDPVEYDARYGRLFPVDYKSLSVVFSDLDNNGKVKYVVCDKNGGEVYSGGSSSRCLDDKDFSVIMFFKGKNSAIRGLETCKLNWDSSSGTVLFGGKKFDLTIDAQKRTLDFLISLFREGNVGVDSDFKKFELDKINIKNSILTSSSVKKNAGKALCAFLCSIYSGCCTWDEGTGTITFVANKGWTSDGKNALASSGVSISCAGV